MLKTIETVIGHWVTIIKAHEKLAITIIFALLLLHWGDKAYDAYGSYLKSKVTADNQQIAQIQSQNAQTQAALQLLTAKVDAQSKIDDAKIAAAKQTIVVKQQEVQNLPLPQLSAEWQSLLQLPDGSITPQSNGNIGVTTDAAHQTVSALVTIQPLKDQLAATQDELNGCIQVRTDQTTQITGLNKEIAAQVKGREDDAKLAKQQQRKSYLRGFKHGFITGAAAAGAAFVAIFK